MSRAIRQRREAIPFLRGERIYLRPLRRADAYGPYVEWLNDAVVCAGNGHHRFPYTIHDALAYIERSQAARAQLALAIARQADGRHLGNIALKRLDYIDRTAELAILIGEPSSWGQGYGKEAARLLLDHAFFTLNLHRVSCGTFESNTPMRRLALSLGMREEGRRREAVFKHNRLLDVIEYGILRREYLARFGAPPDLRGRGALRSPSERRRARR